MALAQIDDLCGSLNALQERWDNRITGKDLRGIGEAYGKGRLSIVLYFQRRRITAVRSKAPSGLNLECGVVDIWAVFRASDNEIVERGKLQRGDDHVVFVGVRGLSDLPSQKVASLVRFYFAKDQEDECGARLNYSTVPWRSLSGSGALEGGLERFPAFINGEVNPGIAACKRSHNAAGQVVEGTIKISEAVANGQGKIRGRLGGFDAQNMATFLNVELDEGRAKIGGCERFEDCLCLKSVAVGPINF